MMHFSCCLIKQQPHQLARAPPVFHAKYMRMTNDSSAVRFYRKRKTHRQLDDQTPWKIVAIHNTSKEHKVHFDCGFASGCLFSPQFHFQCLAYNQFSCNTCNFLLPRSSPHQSSNFKLSLFSLSRTRSTIFFFFTCSFHFMCNAFYFYLHDKRCMCTGKLKVKLHMKKEIIPTYFLSLSRMQCISYSHHSYCIFLLDFYFSRCFNVRFLFICSSIRNDQLCESAIPNLVNAVNCTDVSLVRIVIKLGNAECEMSTVQWWLLIATIDDLFTI